MRVGVDLMNIRENRAFCGAIQTYNYEIPDNKS